MFTVSPDSVDECSPDALDDLSPDASDDVSPDPPYLSPACSVSFSFSSRLQNLVVQAQLHHLA
jgi:hypothetical protein